MLPAWSAAIVQVPAATRVIVKPLTVQTAGVVELRVTARPDEAVGVTVSGDWARVLLEIAAKVIVWLTLLTLKLRVTVGAGL